MTTHQFTPGPELDREVCEGLGIKPWRTGEYHTVSVTQGYVGMLLEKAMEKGLIVSTNNVSGTNRAQWNCRVVDPVSVFIFDHTHKSLPAAICIALAKYFRRKKNGNH
jgi:hypothetical protein